MPRVARYSCAATAALLGYSASYFSTIWRDLVADGRLPEPLTLNPTRPKFPAEQIDQIVEANKWLCDFEPPARPQPHATDGNPVLLRRLEEKRAARLQGAAS